MVHVRVRVDGVVFRQFHEVLSQYLAEGEFVAFVVAPRWKPGLVVFVYFEHVCVTDLEEEENQFMLSGLNIRYVCI